MIHHRQLADESGCAVFQCIDCGDRIAVDLSVHSVACAPTAARTCHCSCGAHHGVKRLGGPLPPQPSVAQRLIAQRLPAALAEQAAQAAQAAAAQTEPAPPPTAPELPADPPDEAPPVTRARRRMV